MLTSNEIIILPSKAVYNSGEDIGGQVIINLKEPLHRAGIIIIALEGKE